MMGAVRSWVLLVTLSLCTYSCSAHDGNEVRDFLADFARTNFAVFNKETLLVLSSLAPLYAMACVGDDVVTGILYDAREHRNIFDVGCCRSWFAEDIGFFAPLLVLAGGLWLSSSNDNCIVGRNLMVGMVSVGCAKLAIKNSCNYQWCYRPYSGCFRKKKVLGGFPSGHGAIIAYATTVLALHKGAVWALPVGMYGGVVLSCSLLSNYHYVSQIIAGMGLGFVYAAASHRVINSRIAECLEVSISANSHGLPQLKLSYSF